jgi:hypothetical protein
MTNRTEGKRSRDQSPSRVVSSKKPMLSKTEDLLSHLHDDNSDDDDDNKISWKSSLEPYTSSQSFADLAKFIATER